MKAMKIMKKLKLEETEQYGSMVCILGRIYFSDHMPAEAHQNFLKATQVLSKFKGGRDYCLAITCLGFHHTTSGNHEEARKLFEESLELTLNRVGNKHPDYGSSLFQVAQNCLSRDKYDDAFRILEEARCIYVTTFGENHTSTQMVSKIIAEAKKVMPKRDKLLVREILQKASTAKDIFESMKEHNLLDIDQFEDSCELLYAVLKEPFVSQLTTEERINVFKSLSKGHTNIGNDKHALTYAQFALDNILELEGNKTERYALALEELATCHMNVNDVVESEKVAREAMDILREDHSDYSGLLLVLGNTQQSGKNFELALELYERAKLKAKPDLYLCILSRMDVCHRELDHWDQAYLIRRESLEIIRKTFGEESLEYAHSLSAMAYIHADMKQFELSCVMFQKSIDIWKRTGERDNEKIIKAEKDLAHMLKQALIVHRENIDVGHAFRICNQCETVSDALEICPACCRAWYCGAECQYKHWPIHKPLCYVCFRCGKVLNRDDIFLRCSRCKTTKYCGSECQKDDWNEHKKTCIPITK
jgi:tetratricopeptide (TPR) repeat protein